MIVFFLQILELRYVYISDSWRYTLKCVKLIVQPDSVIKETGFFILDFCKEFHGHFAQTFLRKTSVSYCTKR